MTHLGPTICQRFRALSGELSGALGDRGTFLPYVVPISRAGIMVLTSVFAGFAVGYAMVTVGYRVPIAVQPMNAVGALLIAGSPTAPEAAWTGVIIAAFLHMFSPSAQLGRATREIPQSVVTGLQVGL